MRTWRDNDKGAVGYLYVAVFIGIAIIGGLTIEGTTANAVRENRYMLAQNAAKKAIDTIDASGSLRKRSIERFIDEYKTLRGYKDVTAIHEAGYDVVGFDPTYYDPKINPHAPSQKPAHIAACDTYEKNGVKYRLPYIEVGLDTRRRVNGIDGDLNGANRPEAVFVSEGFGPLQPVGNAEQVAKQGSYRVLTVHMVDKTASKVMNAFIPCQTYFTDLSSIVFADSEDIEPGVTPSATP